MLGASSPAGAVPAQGDEPVPNTAVDDWFDDLRNESDPVALAGTVLGADENTRLMVAVRPSTSDLHGAYSQGADLASLTPQVASGIPNPDGSYEIRLAVEDVSDHLETNGRLRLNVTASTLEGSLGLGTTDIWWDGANAQWNSSEPAGESGMASPASRSEKAVLSPTTGDLTFGMAPPEPPEEGVAKSAFLNPGPWGSGGNLRVCDLAATAQLPNGRLDVGGTYNTANAPFDTTFSYRQGSATEVEVQVSASASFAGFEVGGSQTLGTKYGSSFGDSHTVKFLDQPNRKNLSYSITATAYKLSWHCHRPSSSAGSTWRYTAEVGDWYNDFLPTESGGAICPAATNSDARVYHVGPKGSPWTVKSKERSISEAFTFGISGAAGPVTAGARTQITKTDTTSSGVSNRYINQADYFNDGKGNVDSGVRVLCGSDSSPITMAGGNSNKYVVGTHLTAITSSGNK